MPDLRTLPNALAKHGDIVTPSLDAVRRRARRVRRRRTTRKVALGLVAVALTPTVADWVANGDESSHVRLVDRTTTVLPTQLSLGSPALGPALPEPFVPKTVAAAATTTTTTVAPTATTAPRPLSCRPGENGGRTDVGVTADRVKLAMTETLEFPTRYTTVEASVPVRALFEEVNARGGICGRLIDFRLANETWGPLPWDPGADVFAGIAGPHDAAVDERVEAGMIDRLGLPFVGLDGHIDAHHLSEWTWPTSLPVASFTRIALSYAQSEGARSFALVYDSTSSAGNQVRAAFEAFLDDESVKHVQAVTPGDDFQAEALEFNMACGLVLCDHVVLAMSGSTALEWVSALPTAPNLSKVLLPTQLSQSFWVGCANRTGARCGELRVWHADGWAPGMFASSEFDACRELDADGEGKAVLISACSLVEALRDVGPNVTRDRLRAAMEHTTLRNGMVAPLQDGKRKPMNRSARLLMPEYHYQPDGSLVVELVDAGSGYRKDPDAR